MIQSSPALYALAVVLVTGLALSVGGNAFSFSDENGVDAEQNRTETTNRCPTVETRNR